MTVWWRTIFPKTKPDVVALLQGEIEEIDAARRYGIITFSQHSVTIRRFGIVL